MKILAIDPGGTTGIAYKDTESKGSPDLYVTATAKTPEELTELITPVLDLVIIENFRAQRIDRHGLYTVRLVGGVQVLCAHLKIKLVVQPPIMRRAFIHEARTLVKPNSVVHEVDALAHLLAWEYKNGYRTGRVATARDRKRR